MLLTNKFSNIALSQMRTGARKGKRSALVDHQTKNKEHKALVGDMETGLKRVMLVAGVAQRLLGKVAVVTGDLSQESKQVPEQVSSNWACQGAQCCSYWLLCLAYLSEGYRPKRVILVSQRLPDTLAVVTGTPFTLSDAASAEWLL